MSTTKQPDSASLRVLVVENDPQWRQDHLENLKSWGYEAYAAEAASQATDRFQTLLKDAKDKAAQHRCHLALVDMRLRSDDDPADISGLDLVPSLAPTVSIIVSGYGDAKTVRAALKSPPDVPERAYDFVGKEDGPDALRIVLEEVEKVIWCRRDVEFVRLDELRPAALARRYYHQDEGVPPDEVDDVLRRLFPEGQRIMLNSIESMEYASMTERTLIRVHIADRHHPELLHLEEAPAAPAARAAVHKDDRHHPVIHQPVIVKLSKSLQVREEIERYVRFVGYFPDSPSFTGIFRQCALWDVGGLIYESAYPWSHVQTFPTVFEEWDTMRIIEVIGKIAESLKMWQDDQHPLEESLFDAYLAKHESAIHQLAQSDDGVTLPDHDVRLPSPIPWALQRREVSHLLGTRQAITHGNLLVGNIFVTEESRVCMIDFSKTGYGHTLRDFAALEADILIGLMSDVDLSLFSELVILAAQSKTRTRELRSTLGVNANPQTRKAFEVIFELRRLAAEVSGRYVDPYEYLWALLLTTLERLIRMTTDHPGYEKTRLLGAVLCQRLENWEDDWPPERLIHIKLLSPAERESHEQEIKRLRQKLSLLKFERLGYGRDVPNSILYEISRVEQELQQLGVKL